MNLIKTAAAFAIATAPFALTSAFFTSAPSASGAQSQSGLLVIEIDLDGQASTDPGFTIPGQVLPGLWPSLWGVDFTDGISSMQLRGTGDPPYHVTADGNPALIGTYSEFVSLDSPALDSDTSSEDSIISIDKRLTVGMLMGVSGFEIPIYGYVVDTAIWDYSDPARPIIREIQSLVPWGFSNTLDEAPQAVFAIYEVLDGVSTEWSMSTADQDLQECLDDCAATYDAQKASNLNVMGACVLNVVGESLVFLAGGAATPWPVNVICVAAVSLSLIVREGACLLEASARGILYRDEFLSCVGDCMNAAADPNAGKVNITIGGMAGELRPLAE